MFNLSKIRVPNLMTAAVCVSFLCACRGEMPEPARTAPVSEKAPNFAENIQPLLQAHCVECHQPGRIGPMPLRTFQEVRPWAKSIAREVTSRRMPPFHAAGPLGRYLDDPRLTEDEIAVFARWVTRGAQRGDLSLVKATSENASAGWLMGEPGLIVSFPQIEVPEGSKELNIYVPADQIIDDELWLRGIDLRCSDPAALHHSNVLVFPETATQFSWATGQNLWVWLPGVRPLTAPPTTALGIPARSRIVLNTHFGPARETKRLKVELGLYFADGEVRQPFGKQCSVLGEKLNIPPAKPDYRYSESQTLTEDVLAVDFSVHMHYRGKSARFEAAYPDGRKEVLFEVPNYDFSWQRTYRLVDPLAIPAGTTIEFIGTFDNSPRNPDNPNPMQRVAYGGKSSDEMFGVGFNYLSVNPAESPFRIVHGRRAPTE